MSRFHRIESPLNYYHVTSRGNNKSFIFSSDEDKEFYMNCVWKYITKQKLKLAAFCIMNNHIHLLIGCELNQLPTMMQALNDSYGQYYNGKYQHIGHVFEKRYFSSPITSEEYFVECIRYIHQNPVKAGICAIDRYRWSSYNNYLFHRGPVSWEKGILLIGDTDAYISFMNQTNPERYPFFDREDLHCTDEEAAKYMNAHLQSQNIDLTCPRKIPSRDKYIQFFYDHWISVQQLANYFNLSPWTIRKILKTSR